MHRLALILLTGCPSTEQQAADIFTEAQLFTEEGDFGQAIKCYDLVIELDPRPVVYLYRAEARLKYGDIEGALADCNEAIRLDPAMADAYLGRVSVNIARMDSESALADLDEAIRLDPTDAASYRVRGKLHEAMGHVAASAADLERAEELERRG